MRNMVEIKNLSADCVIKKILNRLNLEIDKNDFVTVIGPNGSGKTTLIKCILGLKEYSGEILIDGVLLSNVTINQIRKEIGVVFDNPDHTFVAETVLDELVFELENMCMSRTYQHKRLEEIVSYFNLEEYLDKNPTKLSGGEKQMVAIAAAVMKKPKILILDEAFTMIDSVMRKKIYSLLKKLNKNEELTIINITHDIEDVLYGSKIVIINKMRAEIHNTKDLIADESKLKSIGFEPPFMANLSLKLKYYGLVDEVITNMNAMVKYLWP